MLCVQKGIHLGSQGYRKFFSLMVDPADLMRMYRHNFQLMQMGLMSLAELEDMLPFERIAYLIMVEEWNAEKEKASKQ